MKEEELPTPQHLTLMAMLFEGGLGIIAVAAAWALGRSLSELIHWTATGALWGTAAALPLVILLTVCIRVPVWPFTDIVDVIDRMLVPLFQEVSPLNLAVISILAGLGEELFFRGLIQQGLADWIGGTTGVWVGLAVASVIFGLLHPVTVTYAVLAGLMGVYLGWLWIETENLLVPITTHAVYDFLILTYLVKIRSHHPEVARRETNDEEDRPIATSDDDV